MQGRQYQDDKKNSGSSAHSGLEPDVIYTEVEVAALLKCSRIKLRTDRMKGRGIPFFYIGSSVRYRGSDIVAYLEASRAIHALQKSASILPFRAQQRPAEWREKAALASLKARGFEPTKNTIKN